MSTYQKLGFAVDQVLSADQTLPANTTPVDSTNTVTLNNTKSDGVHVCVVAGSVTVELAGGNSLEIRPTVGLTASAVTTVLPSILIKQGVQTDVSWAPGELIAQFVIPAALIGANRYLKLAYVTSANESDDKVDSFTTLR